MMAEKEFGYQHFYRVHVLCNIQNRNTIILKNGMSILNKR